MWLSLPGCMGPSNWGTARMRARTCKFTPSLYAVAVLKEETVVGHVLRKISIVCYTFLRRGRTIVSTITGTRRYSHDLVQGGWKSPVL